MTQVVFQHTLSRWYLLKEEPAEEDGNVNRKNEQKDTELILIAQKTLEELMISQMKK